MTSRELIACLLHYISEDDTELTKAQFLRAVRDRITDDDMDAMLSEVEK